MKVRESNFELLRIIAILMVLFGHVNGIAFPPMSHADVLNAPGICFSRMLFGQFCCIAVDVFILISGYFSIKPKLKSILNFAYLILFWRVLTCVGQVWSGDIVFSIKTLVVGINPLKIWFIRDYITLMIFAPVLNAFCENKPKEKLFKYIACYYAIAFVADFIIPIKLWGLFGGGYSFFGFVGLYLLGRWLRLCGTDCCLNAFSTKKLAYSFVGVMVVSACISFFVRYFITNQWVCDRIGCFLGYYTSPFVVAGALFFFLLFRRLSFSSVVINHIALSVFAVYLAHSPTAWFWRCVKEVFAAWRGAGWIAVGLFALLVFTATIVVDQVRIYSWRFFSHLFSSKEK